MSGDGASGKSSIQRPVQVLQLLPVAQAEYLKDLYVLGINIARERAAGSRADLEVAASAMDLMCVILEWDWRPSDMPAAAAQRMVADAAQVRLDSKSWSSCACDGTT
jgi:hypothetical protein